MCGRFSKRIVRRQEQRAWCAVRIVFLHRSLYDRGVPLQAVENALLLAAARRSVRPADAPPLGTIRSLAYFLPVIEEVLQLKVGQEYFQHLRNKLQRAIRAR